MGIMVLMIIAASLLVGCTNLGMAGVEPGFIHVGGKVLCQDCTQGWSEWVHGANPIKGGKVCLTCMDERNRVVYYGSDETDGEGEFEMIVNKYINGKELKPKLCWVRLVSSGHPTCKIATDFGGGCKGVKLSRPSLVYRDLIKYKLSPFYYTTPMCDKPDTSASVSGGGTNY